MSEPFLRLPDLEALDAALARSDREPIILFKHSPTCGISAQAFHELSGWLSSMATPAPAYVVAVRAAREVSDAIADRFRVRHESPQALLIDRGAVRWHGSHWHVNSGEVQAALASLSAHTAG